MLLPKPHLLKRSKDIAWLLIKHGGRDLVESAGIGSVLGSDVPDRARGNAEELARDLEELGPTFVKLGQLLASRADFLPPPYLTALARLQDHVEPFPFEQVQEIIEEELGISPERAFASLDPEPLAAASLGQVHRARLPDGRRVAVKVQRPGIRRQIVDDLSALEEIAAAIDRHSRLGRLFGLKSLVHELRRAILDELDYRTEAANLRRFHEILAGFDHIMVPAPIDDHTTTRVLTMEFIEGTKIDELPPEKRDLLDGEMLAEELFRAYLRQILIDGFFHADPHPGNVLLMADGRIALLDLGQVGHLPSSLQEPILRLLMAVASGNGEQAARIALRVCSKQPDADERRFLAEIADLFERSYQSDLDELHVGRLLLDIARVAGSTRIQAPASLTVLGKALLQLDEVGQSLAPEFNPRSSLLSNLSTVLRRRMEKDLSPAALLGKLAEVKDLVVALPERLNRLLDILTSQDLQVRVDVIDELRFLTTLQRLANRITAGIVLAALIMGAALLVRVDTSFTLFGYPGIAILFFLFAAAGGVVLLWSIFWGDRGIRK